MPTDRPFTQKSNFYVYDPLKTSLKLPPFNVTALTNKYFLCEHPHVYREMQKVPKIYSTVSDYDTNFPSSAWYQFTGYDLVYNNLNNSDKFL